MDSLKVTSISAVQARQRAGRAGRTRAGRCFRLYTREHFELDMPTTTVPEIQRTSLVGTVLYLKTLRIEGLDVLVSAEKKNAAARETVATGLLALAGCLVLCLCQHPFLSVSLYRSL